MHKCAGVHNAMTTITNSEHGNSEQHVDFRTSRSHCDSETWARFRNGSIIISHSI